MNSFIDLFAGIGGFHIAMNKITKNKLKCVFVSEKDKYCRKVYSQNFNIPENQINTDITKIDETKIPKFDVLCAGFSCQPFSSAGNKKSFNDSRGLLFNHIIRIAKYHKPKICILENVKHILKIDDGKVYKYIYKQLQSINYSVINLIINPIDLNIPQNRERVIFICIRNDLAFSNWQIIFYKQFLELKEKYKRKNKNFKVFQDEKKIDKKYYIDEEKIKVLIAWDDLIKQLPIGTRMGLTIAPEYVDKKLDSKSKKWQHDWKKQNIQFFKEHKQIIIPWYKKYKQDLSRRVIYQQLDWQCGIIKQNDSIFNQYIQFRQSGIRVKRNDYFPALVAVVQTSIIGKFKRQLTPRECSRLQCIPDNYKFLDNDKQTYKQLGNGVCTDVISIVIETLQKIKLIK